MRVRNQKAQANLIAFLNRLEGPSSAENARNEIDDEAHKQASARFALLDSIGLRRIDGRPRYARYYQDAGCSPRIVPKRNFALKSKRLGRLKQEYKRTRRLPNPHRPGCYHFIIEALHDLGLNKYHAFRTFRAKIEQMMGVDRWRAFANRESPRHRPRRVENLEADVEARLKCNCHVLQRTSTYGLKLLQVGHKVLKGPGCVIDIMERGGTTYYRLNTKSAQPAKPKSR